MDKIIGISFSGISYRELKIAPTTTQCLARAEYTLIPVRVGVRVR
jgi:hypothetical protein